MLVLVQHAASSNKCLATLLPVFHFVICRKQDNYDKSIKSDSIFYNACLPVSNDEDRDAWLKAL